MYGLYNLESRLPDPKTLDISNDAIHDLEAKSPMYSKCCLYCSYFAMLYNGIRGTLGACFNDKSTLFFKSVVPGWGWCSHYLFGRYPIHKEGRLER